MIESGRRNAADVVAENLYDLESVDPRAELVDRSSLSPQDLHQISRLMKALADLREAERAASEASEKYMRLSAQHMRALHYLIMAKHRGELVTPSRLAAHLGISPASMTKLLDRLERDGHVVRTAHPLDRRAFSIVVTPETEASATQTVGKHQARRVRAAARLGSEERETVIRFLADMTEEISLTHAEWAP